MFLGHGYQPHPIAPETTWLGLEDARVLARMLENYEEDVADGVREYNDIDKHGLDAPIDQRHKRSLRL